MTMGTMAQRQEPVSMTIPFAAESARHVRQALASWLARRGSSPHVVEDARLVASELVGNTVRHASPLDDNTLTVHWQEEDSALVLSVCDGGGSSQARRVEATPHDVRGRGLAIVDALSATWWVERTHRRQVVHVRLPLD
jgi:serine/threonine-protein kinase RsbW